LLICYEREKKHTIVYIKSLELILSSNAGVYCYMAQIDITFGELWLYLLVRDYSIGCLLSQC